MPRMTRHVIFMLLTIQIASSFAPQNPIHHYRSRNAVILPVNNKQNHIHQHYTKHDFLSQLSSQRGNDQDSSYSREVRLREEAESPFRKVRFLLYTATLAGAFTSLAVSSARIAAGLSGVNSDLLNESVTNAVVDIAGLVIIGFLYKRDLDAQESRLKRAQKGAELAQLTVRGRFIRGGSSTSVVPLSALRRGRGIEKRVVICAGGSNKMEAIFRDVTKLSESLIVNDLLIVPVLIPQCTSPSSDIWEKEIVEQLECVALPAGGNWRSVLEDETQRAREQGVDVEKEGFCVVLKKNGRVGQRTRGVFLGRMVGEVEERRDMGMDVTNI
eukprot:CAMPEP_0172509686 /NCGR_PEP_ID=MMETSP1066-20121228/222166_1 /TAXON_ID=671091 /ORGANISM="Coscinodiscus wailesii, Strain CCMP2513" /LENGTH=327 /DNA_ID=CAMNT_0013288281 /DNA_START=14 /DNA_END=997 /DNA_ORIENTATION=+